MKWLLKQQDSQMFGVSNLTNISTLQPLEVVGRGSKTQFQVGKNVNYLIYHDKGESLHHDPALFYWLGFLLYHHHYNNVNHLSQ